MERLLADIVRRVDRSRFDSQVLALQYLGRFAEGLSEFATLHVAEPLPRWSMLWPGPLIRHIARIAPDVVHTHSGVWYKASLAARRAGVPLVIHTEHGRQRPDPWHHRLVDRLASVRTDVVIAVSQALAQQLATTIVSDHRRIRVVHNGVDTELFRPRADNGALRQELGLTSGRPVIGSVGRLEHIKGYDVMIEAFARLSASHIVTPAPALVLGGHGLERARLEGLAQTLGVRDSVFFLGWRNDIHDLHATFTIFTLSSRSEGTSVSLLEAMSAGLCPVVTDVGGNAAILSDTLRHRLVPAENPQALATAWLHALTEPARRQADALAARARVSDSFRLEGMVRQYEQLYERGTEGMPWTAF